MYVDVPDPTCLPTPRAGAIEFGPFPLGPAADDTLWPGRMLQPSTGELLLFPSYFGHRTWPTEIATDRVCIAFDVLRKGVGYQREPTVPWSPPSPIDTDEEVVRHDRTVSTSGDLGAVVVMNVDSGRYLRLDTTGALVWELLVQRRSVREVTGELLTRFDADGTQIESDVAKLIGTMCALDIVRRA